MQHPIQPIQFDQYEKISDDIFSLGPNAILRFYVQLAKYNQDTNERSSFHKEYGYHLPRKARFELITLRRSYDYYMVLENIIPPKGGGIELDKAYIRIGPSEFMNIKYALDRAMTWFTSQEYSKLYGIKNNKIILRPPIPHEEINNLPMGKYIRFEPTVITRFDHSQEQGLTIYLSSDLNTVNINIDKLMGLIYVFSSFNMIQSAQLMINYLQRPEYGTNYTSFVKEYIKEEQAVANEDKPSFNSTSGVVGRKIKTGDISDLE